MSGCGCLALLVAAIAFIVFFVYASTDVGPPPETESVLLLVAAIVASIIGGARALGVLGRRRRPAESRP